MIPFEAPVEEILFSLDHVAGAGRLPGWDADLVREIVTQFARLAESAIAPADEAADRLGCVLDGGRVRMPGPLVAAYADFAAQGWPALTLPEEAGGQGMPGPVAGAVTEIFAGASHALQMVAGLVPAAARTIATFGTAAQKALWLPRLASGAWLATMALTEPGAGSDLSALRTRAEGGRITGEKIFISGGDQDLTPRILHLVLARTGGAGVKGLSLFLIPSHDDAGNRLPVTVTRIEEKMGLHGSPTCQMLFDAAPGDLLGEEGEGLRVMFTMMNHARLDVALQGVAHATRAGRIATAYAATRRQGRGLTIDQHPDVRRMLDDMAALALGGRGLAQLALVELELGERPELVDVLTPLCKFTCTEAGITAANLGVQVLGGYGYLREYRMEQVLRDARICAIYEGTNGIQAITLATRLLRRTDAFAAFLAERPETLALWQEVRARMLAVEDPVAAADAFMRLTAEAALAVVWHRIAASGRFDRLAAREAGLHPIRMRFHAEMVGLALRA
ncbi:acyl-CoA dehydrogenase family protein [Paenirhodobacter sp.]|uniref:acyl-CoA dehydrogenase family protein n=1 Tax=Paenirhodobacter sp. TaxID=1965326 RepID=UPI003B3EBDD5